METDNGVKALLAAGAAMDDLSRIENGKPYCVVPEDWRLQDLSAFLDKPLRVDELVRLDEVESFVNYLNAYGKVATLAVFAKVNALGATFRAVLDYHHAETLVPGWCQHVVEYNCPSTVEWRRWTECNNKMMDQTTFAEFIEQNQLEVVKPTGADLLEMVMTLKAKSNVDFVSGVRLANGANQLQYQETISASAGQNGNVQVPEELELAVPVFQNGPRYTVRAFLRYRITNKKLHFCYVLFNPHKVVEHAARAVFAQVEQGTKVKPYV